MRSLRLLEGPLGFLMQSLAEYLFRAQRRGELRFLLIGGRSLEAHGYVRNTKDVDFSWPLKTFL